MGKSSYRPNIRRHPIDESDRKARVVDYVVAYALLVCGVIVLCLVMDRLLGVK